MIVSVALERGASSFPQKPLHEVMLVSYRNFIKPNVDTVNEILPPAVLDWDSLQRILPRYRVPIRYYIDESADGAR